MVSNDMRETAEKVAQKAGILKAMDNNVSEFQVMSGDDFAERVGALEPLNIGNKKVTKKTENGSEKRDEQITI